MHQMIPHHENAVNMARVLLLNPGDEDLDEEVNQYDLKSIMDVGESWISIERAQLTE